MSSHRPLRKPASWMAQRLLVLLAIVALSGCSTGPNFANLEARVEPAEPLDLPPNAELTVRLVDVSRSGADVIAESTYTRLGRGPIPVMLRYDTRAIDADRAYALRAEIHANRALTHTSTEDVAVLTGEAPTVGIDIPVEAVQ